MRRADDPARERGPPARAEHPSEDARLAHEACAPAGVTPVEDPGVGSPGHSRQHAVSHDGIAGVEHRHVADARRGGRNNVQPCARGEGGHHRRAAADDPRALAVLDEERP